VEITDTPPRLPDNEVIPEADLYLVPTLLDGASFLIFLRTVDVLERRKALPAHRQPDQREAGSPSPPPGAPQDVGRYPGAGSCVVCGLLRGGKDRVRPNGRWARVAQEEIHALAVRVRDTLAAGAGRRAAA
jgi:chromosome partitioning protein